MTTRIWLRRIGLTLGGAFLITAGVIIGGSDRVARAGSNTIPLAHRSEEEERVIRVYKQANEAVAFISTITLAVDPADVFVEVQPKEGTGSGIVIDSRKGIILTNLHVIQDAHKIDINLADGKSHQARLLGFDQEYDIAVLQVVDPPKDMVAIPFADSSKLEVGQFVLAIGNPFGLNRTLTSGIISNLDRTMKGANGKVMKGLIQTDAAINPGNSGGPLLDMDGRLVGINTAILSQSGDSAGIGFAVPINQIKRVLPELIATGKVLRPRMGWALVDTNQGPMVRRVAPDGPAAAAGIQPIEREVSNVFIRGYVRDFDRADLITKINEKPVTNRDEVEEVITQSDAHKPIVVALRRGGLDGPERTVTVTPVLQ